MATDIPGDRRRRGATKDPLQRVAETFDKLSRNLDHKQDQIQAKVARHTEQIDRLQERLGVLDVWCRDEPAERRPRFCREDIAAAALRIADAEGFSAVSMRRLAAELGAGTMTLYHYIRTKDELLALVTDAVMGEVVVPHELPADWREAITLVARRTREAMRRHPWMFDIVDEPAIGPNAVRHFDQTMQAVATVPADLTTKLDIVFTVDEFVFGHCLQERNNLGGGEHAIVTSEMVAYVNDLLHSGDYPQLSKLARDHGTGEVWEAIDSHQRDAHRFERNLRRIVDGFDAALRH